MPAGRRRRLACLLVGLFLLGAFAVPGGAEPVGSAGPLESSWEWRALESPEERFRVAFPGEPAFRESTTPTALGAVRDSIWRLARGPVELALELHALPRIASLLMSDDLILASVASSVVGDVNGSLVSESQEIRAGRPARRLAYELPGAPARLEEALIVLDRARVFVLTTTRGKGLARPAAFERFFESFELIGGE